MPDVNIDKEELQRLCNEGLSKTELAKRCGVSRYILEKIAGEYGIPVLNKYEAFVGKEINHLLVKRFFKDGEPGKRNRMYYECECVCGNTSVGRADHIRNGACKSCGCMTIHLGRAGHTLPNNRGAINDVFRGYKAGAKCRDIPFGLTREEFESIIFKNCFYCDRPPILRSWKKVVTARYISLHTLAYSGIDRMDSNLGYVMANCVPCCAQCNYAKSDLSLDEFREWMRQVVKFNTPQIPW